MRRSYDDLLLHSILHWNIVCQKKDGKEQFRKAHSRRSRSKIYEKECMYNKYTWKTLSSLFLFILCTSITTTTLVAENKNHSFMYVAFANSKHIPLSPLFLYAIKKIGATKLTYLSNWKLTKLRKWILWWNESWWMYVSLQQALTLQTFASSSQSCVQSFTMLCSWSECF